MNDPISEMIGYTLTYRVLGSIINVSSDEEFGRDWHRINVSAEGECENSQAKGPDLDDTLESDLAPKKQFSVLSI